MSARSIINQRTGSYVKVRTIALNNEGYVSMSTIHACKLPRSPRFKSIYVTCLTVETYIGHSRTVKLWSRSDLYYLFYVIRFDLRTNHLFSSTPTLSYVRDDDMPANCSSFPRICVYFLMQIPCIKRRGNFL